jgi:uncharacterized integral membrane protein
MSDQSKRGSQLTRHGAREPEGVNWKRWALGIAVVLLAIIALQNSQKVEIKLLFINGETPLIVGLLIAGALGAVIGYITPLVRRGRRTDTRSNKD